MFMHTLLCCCFVTYLFPRRDLRLVVFDGDRDVWRNERMFSTRVSLEAELPGALAGVHT